jgi:hypothetical protein
MDPIDFFTALGVEFAQAGDHHHTRDGWMQLKNCPGCGSDNYHLGFNLAGRYFVCWRCGGMKTIFVLQSLGADRKTIEEFFKGLDLPELTSRPVFTLVQPRGRGPLLKAHRTYLRERKFNPEELTRIWELEGIGIATELAWRLYIPVIENGHRVSWTTRALGDKSQRYVSASQSQEVVPHKHCIYGAGLARHSIVIVEGPTDAWRIGPGAGALFGTAFTTAQVRKISRYPYRYILFDNEAVAQRKARDLAEQLAAFPGETTILECDAKDPGQMDPKSVRQLRRITRLGEFR